ncbi:MAG TPA: DHA2 family efflux MFS transporter permease subunit [Solirubrobacteraceae bacterium]|nr:DHA2 family efflux MFS transporter permease subunit [Solirubrobacteraceae bacterium]
MADGTETTPPAKRRQLIGEAHVAVGADAGLMIALADGTVVGREGADVELSDATGELSRKHARFALRDGEPVVEDLGSTNGTYVNDQRIIGAHRLQPGDRIRLGGTTLEFSPRPDLAPVARLQATRAREIPVDVTRVRPVPLEATQARATPPVVPGPTFAPSGSDGELIILSGPGAGTATAVTGSATIGREPECDLQVLDPEVSRRHAKVVIGDARASIDDLHSANGTYVNGERILRPYTLAPGDQIQIGEATIQLSSPILRGVAEHKKPLQVTGLRQALAEAPQLLTAESSNRKWWTLAVVLSSTFMLLLDVTIVAVALPTISAALHASFSAVQWIVDGYAIMLTTMLLAAASLADIIGRKVVLRLGLIVFTLASVACAQAPNATVLDFARGVQGIGGAMMFACSLALIVQEFPAQERQVAFGAYGVTTSVSIALGPIIGGVLVQAIGWQAIFYVNVPIGIAALIMLQRKVVNLPGPETSIDWGGLVTFTAAMLLLMYATIRGNDDGWTSPTILGCYGAAIALFAVFIPLELSRRFPMMDLKLFKNPTFIGSSVSAFVTAFSVLSLIFFITAWFQSILGYSAVEAGLRMLVFTSVAFAVGPLAGRMTATVDPRIVLTASLMLGAIGAAIMTGVNGHSSWTVLIPGLVLTGASFGLIGPTLASTAVGVVPPYRGGMAGGINAACRSFGTAAGLAVLGVLLQHQVVTHVKSAVASSPFAPVAKGLANGISAGATPQLLHKFPAAVRPGLQNVARDAYAAGLTTVFTVAAAVAAVGAIVAFALVRKRHLLRPGGPPPGGPPAGGRPTGGPPTPPDRPGGGPVVSRPRLGR